VLIAPQLAFHRAIGTTLLGPSGWNDPDLVKIGREHVEGAVFTAQFQPTSRQEIVRDFTGRFDRAYAAPPDVIAAQAFDAANLVLMQLARGRDTRDDVREGILAVSGYPGVTGVMTMRKDGNAKKRPFLVSVDRGRLKPIE
jgi:branched-chain amino acid transport system substrate-binding protein